MLLDLKKIFLEEGEHLKINYEADFSDFDFHNERPFVSPVNVDGVVENRAGLVEMSIDVSFDFKYLCDRCMAETQKKFCYNFKHILVLSLSDESGDDYIEAPDYKLSLDSLLRDDILLELPSKLLCKESCKGLCQKCGKNLNEGECGCSTTEPDPRLAALKALL